MKFLLDTHVFIWYVTDHSRLSDTVLASINDENHEIFLSRRKSSQADTSRHATAVTFVSVEP
jgi:uncharacterized membrane protein YvbJ